MKKSVLILSMAAVLAFGDTMSAEEKQSALDKLAESKLIKALANSTISGFAFGRYRFNGGRDSEGNVYHWRTIANLETGRYSGWALGTGAIFTIGAIAADNRSSADWGGVFGSRASRNGKSGNDIFGINSLYISKEMGSADKVYFKTDAGMLRMNTTFADNNLDRAIGAEFKLKAQGVQYSFGAYDSFITDSLALSMAGRGQSIQNQIVGAGFSNHLFLLEAKNDSSKFAGFGFNLGYGYGTQLFDYLVFAELSYGIAGFGIKAQTAAAGLNSSAKLQFPRTIGAGNNTISIGSVPMDFNLEAQHRGVYNVVLSYNTTIDKHGFKSKVGYLGSYGDGYGVGLKTNAGLDFGGKSWFNGLTTTKEGFSFLGVGSIKGSNISSAYLALAYEYDKKYGVGLDIAYVGGNNYMPILSKSTLTSATTTLSGGKNFGKVKSQDLLEISPSVSYKPISHFTISAFISFFALDASWQYYTLEANYKF
ncbi:hypothetical protein [uncultured Helicobacter sp.]|uniref:hypothetical protein n=1 Tax=uncultured Helicobacter sp. TaxID=175537 RepID=UPI002585C4C8|nr:hypothetical protein [uncultured Helicobacter sp.]